MHIQEARLELERRSELWILSAELVGYKRRRKNDNAIFSEHLSVEQIAAHLGVTRDSIYRWIDSKGLPAHRLGRLWKFKISEGDGWVRATCADDRKDQPGGGRP